MAIRYAGAPVTEAERLAGHPVAFILGLDLLIRAVGQKDDYGAADHAAARLPMVMSCTRCAGTMAGAAARLYPRKGSYAAYCGSC